MDNGCWAWLGQEREIYHVNSILLQSLLRLYYQFWPPQVLGCPAILQVQFRMSPANMIACWYYLLASEQNHYISSFLQAKKMTFSSVSLASMNIIIHKSIQRRHYIHLIHMHYKKKFN